MKSLLTIALMLMAQSALATSPNLKSHKILDCGEAYVEVVTAFYLNPRDLDLEKALVFIVDVDGRYRATVTSHSEGYDFSAVNKRGETVSISSNGLGKHAGYGTVADRRVVCD